MDESHILVLVISTQAHRSWRKILRDSHVLCEKKSVGLLFMLQCFGDRVWGRKRRKQGARATTVVIEPEK